MWYPTIDQLLKANLIDGIVDRSEIKAPAQILDVETVLAEFSDQVKMLKFIKINDAKLYDEIRTTAIEAVANGASSEELSLLISQRHIKPLADRLLSKADDESLVKFYRADLSVLQFLEAKDPHLCITAIYPEYFGYVPYLSVLNSIMLAKWNEAYSAVIIAAYSGRAQPLDVPAAEALLVNIAMSMEDDFPDVDPSELRGKEDYSRHCGKMMSILEQILKLDQGAAANMFRYMNQKT
jgi:hypothetical protein